MNSGFHFSKAGKYKAISNELKIARFSLIDYVIETKKAIPSEKAADIIGQNALNELLQKNIVNANQDNAISCLYPVSAADTGHSVKLADGRQFSTMCAFDSLGCAGTFHMDCEIFSFCKDTNERVCIKISEQEIKTALPSSNIFVSYLDKIGEGSCGCCGVMNFFQYEKHARDLLKQYEHNKNMYFWTLNDAFTAAKMVFEN